MSEPIYWYRAYWNFPVSNIRSCLDPPSSLLPEKSTWGFTGASEIMWWGIELPAQRHQKGVPESNYRLEDCAGDIFL